MATTLMPLDPATSPERVWRNLTIAARLLPEEVIAGRRARQTRTVVLVIVLVVVLLLGGWFAYAAHTKSQAVDELARYSAKAAELQQKQNSDFKETVATKTESDLLDKQLSTLMTNDLPWATLLATLNSTASSTGVSVTGFNANLLETGTGAQTATSTATGLPSTSGATKIGSLVVTGTGPDKATIGKYVTALGAAGDSIANPYLTSVTQGTDSLQYSLQLDITSAALCGRFSTPHCKTGGN